MCVNPPWRGKTKTSALMFADGCRRLLYFPSAPQTGGKYVCFLNYYLFQLWLLGVTAPGTDVHVHAPERRPLGGGGNGAGRKLELSGVMATAAD